MREARHLARCRICREAGPDLGTHLRALPTTPMSAIEQARVWRGIESSVAVRPRWWTRVVQGALGFRRRRPVLAWTPAVAAAAAVLLVLAPMHVGDNGRPLAPAHVAAHTTIETVEAGLAASVLVLDAPSAHLPIIWVTEAEGPERKAE